MADAENALPPSKKRVAGRELSRDNPGLDDEESSEQELGTFKRASEEVLATRKIVKVRRQQPASAGSGTPASANPFASIQLVPATQSTEKTTAKESDGTAAGVENQVVDAVGKDSDAIVLNGTEKEKDDSAKQISSPLEKKEEALIVVADEIKKELTKDTSEEIEVKLEAEGEEAKNETAPEKVEEKSESGDRENKTENMTPLSSFQELSSSQNAFTNLAGTGFSSSSFSFGSFPKDGSGFGSASGSLFGPKIENSSFPSFGICSSNNGTSSNSIGSSAPVMKEVPVETGEENENAIFAADAVLFEYVDGGWKERGKGELKVNVSSVEPEKARLVMRARGNYRLILNASLYTDMKFTNMDKRGITFACVNSSEEGKGGLSTFALKFKDGTIVEQFRAAVEANKNTKNAALKTPENSPKASDG